MILNKIFRKTSVFWSLLLIAALSVFAYFSLSGKYKAEVVVEKSIDINSTANVETLSLSDVDVSPPDVEVAAIADEVKVESNINWLSNVGYFSTEQQNLYKSYDTATLRNLSDGGDLLAYHLLYLAALESGDLGGAREILYNSIVHGSVFGLEVIATSQVPDPREEEELGASGYKDKWISAMAWYEVAIMRGHEGALRDGLNLLERNQVKLSPSDVERISGLAKSRYDALEKARFELGLPGFENSASKHPLGVTGIPEPAKDDWGAEYYETLKSKEPHSH